MKKLSVTLWVVLATVCFSAAGLADEMTEAAQRAKEIHQRAASDVIYTQDELKALYYQNVQIIDLLREIRDNLSRQLENAKR